MVEKVASAEAADCRNGIWLAETEFVEFGDVVEPIVRVDFVGNEQYGLL